MIGYLLQLCNKLLCILQAEYVLKKELNFLDEQGFEGGSDSTERNVKFYACGNFEQMITSESLLPVPIHDTHSKRQQQLVKGIEEVLTTHMILKRNRKMARKLISTIKSNPTKIHFFAIGAGIALLMKSNCNSINAINNFLRSSSG